LFFTFCPVLDGPGSYGRSIRFDTTPSNPSLHACSKIIEPSLSSRCSTKAGLSRVASPGASYAQVATSSGNPHHQSPASRSRRAIPLHRPSFPIGLGSHESHQAGGSGAFNRTARCVSIRPLNLSYTELLKGRRARACCSGGSDRNLGLSTETIYRHGRGLCLGRRRDHVRRPDRDRHRGHHLDHRPGHVGPLLGWSSCSQQPCRTHKRSGVQRRPAYV
jgi:hypothetical protein